MRRMGGLSREGHIFQWQQLGQVHLYKKHCSRKASVVSSEVLVFGLWISVSNMLYVTEYMC